MLFGQTTILDGGAIPDQNGRLPIIKQSTAPFSKHRVDDVQLEDVNRALHLLEANIHDVVQGVRRLPEAGPRTYIKNVSFTVGVAKTFSHMLGIAFQSRAASLLGTSAGAAAVSPEQVCFEIVNCKNAVGNAYRSAVDARSITLIPNATFIGDVRLYITP